MDSNDQPEPVDRSPESLAHQIDQQRAARPPHRFHWSLERLAIAVLSVAVVALTVALVVAFVNNAHLDSRLHRAQAAVDSTSGDIATVQGKLTSVQSEADGYPALLARVKALESSQGANSSTADVSQNGALARIADALALQLFVSHNPGQTFSSTDAGVKACVAYLVAGTSSGVECGFTRANP